MITDSDGMFLGTRRREPIHISKLFRLLEIMHDGAACLVRTSAVCKMENMVLSHVDPSSRELQSQRRNVPEDERMYENDVLSDAVQTPSVAPGAIVLQDEEEADKESSCDDGEDDDELIDEGCEE